MQEFKRKISQEKNFLANIHASHAAALGFILGNPEIFQRHGRDYMMELLEYYTNLV